MKKKILYLSLILTLTFTLTACSNNSNKELSNVINGESNTIQDDLNNLMDKIEKEEDNFHVATIQEYLEENSNYRLIAGSNEPFTSLPESSRNQYTYVQQNEQLINTSSNYVLIYNTNTKKYYSIPVGQIGYKPYFNEAIELN